MSRSIRSFFSIELPPAAKLELGKALDHWDRIMPVSLRMASSENLHLTLKFLGDIQDHRLESVTQAAERAVTGLSTISLWTGGVQAFPNHKKSRIVFVQVSGQIERLNLLHHRLEEELFMLGFPREVRPFSPHLTLGRVKKPQFAPLRFDESLPSIRWQVNKLTLMKSTLGNSGSTYKPLRVIYFS